MSDPFVAEIRIFPFNFAPRGWAFCDGQLLATSQNSALFALLGTSYGGDGEANFALPNLQGCAALGQGQGPGLSNYAIGQEGGSDTVTLIPTEIPIHSHAMQGVTNPPPATGSAPSLVMGMGRSNGGTVYCAPNNLSQMSPNAIGLAGGSLPHNNMMPYLTMNFCIALQGAFPSRN